MTHLNETIYSTGVASSYQATATKSGVYINDDMLSNVCKHHVTKMPYEIGRLAQDLAGGLVVTLPSEQDLKHPKVGELIRKYLKGREDIPTEDRIRILRLIENMTLGRNAVGYLTESMHGAGSPQAQRIQIARQMQVGVQETIGQDAGRNSGRIPARNFRRSVGLLCPRVQHPRQRHQRYQRWLRQTATVERLSRGLPPQSHRAAGSSGMPRTTPFRSPAA